MNPRHVASMTPDGRTLSCFVWGSGRDLVVFEAGLGASGRYWAPTARLLPPSTLAVAYDRAGFGRSTPDAAPRTLDRLADDLCCVIAALPHDRLVLVGHSWGGPVVRRAAQRLSGTAVNGLVLVDPADENMDGYFSRWARVGDAIQAVALPSLARLGVLRAGMFAASRHGLWAEERRATVYASSSVAAARATVAKNRWVREGLRELRERGGEPRVPVTIISGTKPAPCGARSALTRAHQRSAADFARGRLVEAPRSQHMIPLTDPAIVAAEVNRSMSA